MRRHEWDPAPPTLRQRIVAGLLLALLALTGANFYFGWKLLGGYDKQAAVLSVIIALIVFLRWMPGTRRT
jgi:hypothetical protein